jgi:16S rRNA (guanine(1405)-N(7))-methyltransferase
MPREEGPRETVRQVLESRRYRRIAPDLIRRVAEEEAAKARRPAEAIKATKRRLHQIVGAFGSEPPYEELLEVLREAYGSGDPGLIREACRSALVHHSSTRERLPILDRLYREAFQLTGPVGCLLDVGCGLGPLALPWMGLPPSIAYRAYEADTETVDFLNEYFTIVGLPALAEARDVVANHPTETGDVALLLKLLPTVEQQGGSALALLDSLHARFVVVSYPVRSLGGRQKGMTRFYETRFRELVSSRSWKVIRLDIEDELVFVVEKWASDAAA